MVPLDDKIIERANLFDPDDIEPIVIRTRKRTWKRLPDSSRARLGRILPCVHWFPREATLIKCLGKATHTTMGRQRFVKQNTRNTNMDASEEEASDDTKVKVKFKEEEKAD